jgi:hypothetical protein
VYPEAFGVADHTVVVPYVLQLALERGDSLDEDCLEGIERDDRDSLVLKKLTANPANPANPRWGLQKKCDFEVPVGFLMHTPY